MLHTSRTVVVANIPGVEIVVGLTPAVVTLIQGIVGKRLTFDQLTGKTELQAEMRP